MKTSIVAAVSLAIMACSPVTPPAESDSQDSAVRSEPADEAPVTVRSWGPQATTPAVPVNPLPGGESGLYFTLSRPIIGAGTEVLFEGRPLPGVVVNRDVITAMVPSSEIVAEGRYRIVIRTGSGRMIEVGDFVVGPVTSADEGDTAEVSDESAG